MAEAARRSATGSRASGSPASSRPRAGRACMWSRRCSRRPIGTTVKAFCKQIADAMASDSPRSLRRDDHEIKADTARFSSTTCAMAAARRRSRPIRRGRVRALRSRCRWAGRNSAASTGPAYFTVGNAPCAACRISPRPLGRFPRSPPLPIEARKARRSRRLTAYRFGPERLVRLSALRGPPSARRCSCAARP